MYYPSFKSLTPVLAVISIVEIDSCSSKIGSKMEISKTHLMGKALL